MLWLTAGCVRPTRSAPRVNVRSSTTARKCSSWSSSIARRAYMFSPRAAKSLSPGSRKRPVDRRTRLREPLRAGFGDVETVLESDPELTVDRDHRLVAEAHPGLQRRLVPPHEVRPLVTVEADAVTCAVRQAGHFVIGAEPGVGNHLARGRVDCLARDARLRGGEGGRLRALLEIPDIDLAPGRLAEDGRARDVRLISVHVAAIVDLHDVAFTELLRRDAAVRERGVLAEADGDVRALRADRAISRVDVVAQVLLRHALAQRGVPGLVRRDRHVPCALHQINLARRLDHPVG